MRFPTILAAVALLLAAAVSGWSAMGDDAAAPDPPIGEIADISGDPEKPRRHFRVPDPARLSPAEASDIYRSLAADMTEIYALSGDPAAGVYQSWTRYNTAPYLSATHGQRYANNFANAIARAYGRFEQSGILPMGSVVAKDSVAATAAGEVFPGPLFLMEKMPAGFSPASGDWRYTMIMPDGSLFGVTGGEGAERVEYCIGCHLARERYDHLYYPPKEFRVSP